MENNYQVGLLKSRLKEILGEVERSKHLYLEKIRDIEQEVMDALGDEFKVEVEVGDNYHMFADLGEYLEITKLPYLYFTRILKKQITLLELMSEDATTTISYTLEGIILGERPITEEDLSKKIQDTVDFLKSMVLFVKYDGKYYVTGDMVEVLEYINKSYSRISLKKGETVKEDKLQPIPVQGVKSEEAGVNEDIALFCGVVGVVIGIILFLII